MKSRWIAIALLAAIVATPALAKKKPLHDIPLVWKPTDEMGELGVVDLTGVLDQRIKFEDFTDGRTETDWIAENLEDADEGKILRVSTPDDVGAWTADRFRYLANAVGYTLDDESPDVVVTGQIRRFFVTEINTYESDVGVRIEVATPEGETLWVGMVSGATSRFGRSYKAANYYETISDAVMRAFFNMAQTPAFRKALKGEKQE